MELEAVVQKIEATYATDKGKGFITHLLRAFFPIDRASKLLVADGRKQICCITGQKVVTHNDYVQRMMPKADALLKETISKLKAEAAGEEYAGNDALQKELDDINALPVAVVSEKSDKMLSPIGFQALHTFYANGIVRGGELARVAKNEQAKAGIKQLEERGTKLSQAEKKVLHKVAENDMTSGGLNLGEITALQELKKRFQADEK